MANRRMQVAVASALLLSCGAPDEGSAAQGGQGQRSAPSERPFTVTKVADFDTPWAMSFLPGSGVPMTNAALVTEKDGRLWLIDAATGRKQAVSGVPAVKSAGQGGLGDVVAHPDFAGNRRIYLTYVEAGPNGTSGAAMGYGTLVLGRGQQRLQGFKVIWRQQPKVTGDGHFSHRIAFARDGTIFLSSGERMKGEPAQDQNSDLGKIVHLTAEGQRIGGRFHTMGHRNILGLAFAPDGRLWATEMGPRGGDELNLIEAGRNYGWPIVSNGSHYGGGGILDHRPGDGFEPPKLWWTPSISPAGMIVYSGNLFPQWRGDAIFGALSGQALIRADLNGASARKADHWPMGFRVREVEQGPRGEIYLLEDGGRLLRLMPANER